MGNLATAIDKNEAFGRVAEAISLFRSSALDDEDRQAVVKAVRGGLGPVKLARLLSENSGRRMTATKAKALVDAIRDGRIGSEFVDANRDGGDSE